MKPTSLIATTMAAATLAFSAGCACKSVNHQNKNNEPESTAQGPSVQDPRALDELKQMSVALTSSQAVGFEVRSMKPLRGPNGQWIHVFTSDQVKLQHPNRLFISTGGDAFPEEIYFDGEKLSINAPGKKLFTQKEVSGDIDAALADLAITGEETFPFADVLLNNPYTSWTQDLIGAVYVGESTRDKEKLAHLAFTAKGVDWEMWLDHRTHLPRMVFVKYTGPAHGPSILMEFSHWKLNAKFPTSTFAFKAPSGAKKATIKAPVASASEGAGK